VLVIVGGCASFTQRDPERVVRPGREHIFYLGGAGAEGPLPHSARGVRDGLRNAGYEGGGEAFSWQTGRGPVADEVAPVDYKRQKAAELAALITTHEQQYPGSDICVMGLSAGTSVAVFSVEALPATASVTAVVLLAGALSADYDMTKVLRRVRDKVYVFTSEKDAVLGLLVPLVGTADRQKGDERAVGLCGFELPAGASDETCRLYQDKIVQIPWSEEFESAGNRGGHRDAVKPQFVQKYVAPLIMRQGAAEVEAAAAEGGVVLNPDFDRWSRFGVGSWCKFRGTVTEDGVRQPVELTVTLVRRHADSLLVERVWTLPQANPPQAPVRRNIFVKKFIEPAEHPATHRHSRLTQMASQTTLVGDQSLGCRVQQINAPAAFADELSALDCTLLLHDDIPGQIAQASARLMRNGEPLVIDCQAVEYNVVREPAAGR
jgi:hypothetical protein